MYELLTGLWEAAVLLGKSRDLVHMKHIHSCMYRYFVEATDLLNLTRKISPDPSFGVFDGENYVMTSETPLWGKAWRYALFPPQLSMNLVSVTPLSSISDCLI